MRDSLASSPQNFSRVSFGGSLRLLSEDYFVRELAYGTGIDRSTFRALCHALHVPLLHTPKGTFVDYSVFMIALKTALRPGALDFSLIPDPPTPSRTSLDEDEAEAHGPFVRDLLLTSRTIHDLDTLSQKNLLKDASSRLRDEYERRGLPVPSF